MTSQVKVDSIRHTGASADAITLASDGSCTAELTNIPKENLVINGDFQVWQRSTDDTSDVVSGYCGPDRWQKTWFGGTVTGKKLDLTSSDTLPWNDGFRSAFQVKCTSTTTHADRYCQVEQVIEAQNIANSGWKYTDSNSKVRIQFYARSSLAGTYWCRFTSVDGTGRSFPYSYSLSANTWTKVSFAVPGDSNVTVDNNNGAGFRLNISQYLNTGLTDDASVTSGSWMNWDSDKAAEDYDQDWIGTTNATFDITGVQITVGEFASEFQHRSYAEELRRCQRYFHRTGKNSNAWLIEGYTSHTGTGGHSTYNHPGMRQKPSVSKNGQWATDNFSSLSFNWRDQHATSVRLIMSSAGVGYAHCSETGSPVVYGSLEFDAEL